MRPEDKACLLASACPYKGFHRDTAWACIRSEGKVYPSACPLGAVYSYTAQGCKAYPSACSSVAPVYRYRWQWVDAVYPSAYLSLPTCPSA
jgi:hypothetical protein